jgi:hypothetical protein
MILAAKGPHVFSTPFTNGRKDVLDGHSRKVSERQAVQVGMLYNCGVRDHKPLRQLRFGSVKGSWPYE